MFYFILKIYARMAIQVYCPEIVINKPHLLQRKGPLLLAANHPNSFLDGMILTTLFQQPVYSLARGDVFKNKKVRKILNWLKLLPVYRTTEGIENLGHNYSTFETCRLAFQQGAVVLIFSEAGSANEWKLRPLRKGTARLAVSSWMEGIPLTIVPVGLNYHSFKSFGKVVHLNFGEDVDATGIMQAPTQGKQLLAFNQNLQCQMEALVYEIDPADKVRKRQLFLRHPSPFTHLLLVPALVGAALHLPLYLLCKLFTHVFFRKSDHYDSVLTATLLLAYPVYMAVLMILLAFWQPLLSLAALILSPVTARAFTQFKTRFEM